MAVPVRVKSMGQIYPFCVHWHRGLCLRLLISYYAVVFRLDWVFDHLTESKQLNEVLLNCYRYLAILGTIQPCWTMLNLSVRNQTVWSSKCVNKWLMLKWIVSNTTIGPAVRVFANGPGDMGSIPGRVIPKTLKMELDTTLLNTQHYKVRFKGKVEQSREWSSALPYTLV